METPAPAPQLAVLSRFVVASAPDRRFAFGELHQDFSHRGNPLVMSIRLPVTWTMGHFNVGHVKDTFENIYF